MAFPWEPIHCKAEEDDSVEKSKAGKEVCCGCFSPAPEETELWNPGAAEEFTRSLNDMPTSRRANETILEISKCPLFKEGQNRSQNLLQKGIQLLFLFLFLFFLRAIIQQMIGAMPGLLSLFLWPGQNSGETAADGNECFRLARAETLPGSPSGPPTLLCSTFATCNPTTHSIKVPRTHPNQSKNLFSSLFTIFF